MSWQEKRLQTLQTSAMCNELKLQLNKFMATLFAGNIYFKTQIIFMRKIVKKFNGRN